jgi:anti-anti-sigma factor
MPGGANTRYSVARSEDGALELRGEFDLAAVDDLRAELYAHAATELARVVVDCSGVEFLDSSGVAVLLEVQEQLRSSGGTIVLTSVPRIVRRTIDITRLDDHVRVE